MRFEKYKPILKGLAVGLAVTLINLMVWYSAEKSRKDTFEFFLNAEIQIYSRLHACKSTPNSAACVDRELAFFKSEIGGLIESAEKDSTSDSLKRAIANFRELEVVNP